MMGVFWHFSFDLIRLWFGHRSPFVIPGSRLTNSRKDRRIGLADERTRHVIAITLLATVLCADWVVARLPVLRPQVASAVGKLVTRLSVTFRRVVPSVQVYQTRGDCCCCCSDHYVSDFATLLRASVRGCHHSACGDFHPRPALKHLV